MLGSITETLSPGAFAMLIQEHFMAAAAVPAEAAAVPAVVEQSGRGHIGLVSAV